MGMEIEGRVIKNLGIKSGVSKAGKTWKKLEFLIETLGTYPKQVLISVIGDKAETMNPQVGDQVTCHVEVSSREYNGNYYTELNCWKLEGFKSVTEKYSEKQQAEQVGTNAGSIGQYSDEDNDSLPF